MPRQAFVILVATVALAAALFSISAIQYASFTREKLYDLGEFDSALWNTVHGRMLQDDPYRCSLLQRHLFLTFLLLAPVYLLCPHPLALLLVQAVAIALTVPVLARLCRTAHVGAGLPMALLLLHPGVVNLAAMDFHPDVFALPLLPLLVLALEEGRPRGALALALATVATKEDLVPTVALLAAAYLPRAGARRAAAAALVTALLWGALAFGLVMPRLQPTGRMWQLDRYERWGDTPALVVTAPVREPRAVWEHVAEPRRQRFVWRLLLPLLPALAARPALAVVPTLCLSLLSTVWMQSSIDHWYHAPALGALAASLPFGIARLKRLSPPVAHVAIAAALAAALYGNATHSHARMLWRELRAGALLNAHDAVGRRALALVPPDVPAIIDNNYAVHAAHRRHIATVIYDPEPTMVRDAVLVDMREGFLARGHAPGHLPELRAFVARMAADARYRKVFDEDGILVWRRR